MKKIIPLFLLLLIALGACNRSKNYVSIETEIVNKKSDTLTVLDEETGNKLKAIVFKDGVFKDTLNVKDSGFYGLINGDSYISVYLRNGFDLKMSFDANKPLETVFYEGEGEKENNVLKEFNLAATKIDFTNMLSLDSLEFKKQFDKNKKEMLGTFEGKDVVTDFTDELKKNLDKGFENIADFYNKKHESSAKNNTAPPSFSYVNYKGGKTKLENFKGKYVYIDIWATWCGPCMKQIPHMKEIEKQYKGKNIVFVSISVDEQGDLDKWKKTVKENGMEGVQLFSDNGFEAKFVTYFNVTAIPRFILIGTDGKVVNANAPWPSDPKLKPILDGLLAKGK